MMLQRKNEVTIDFFENYLDEYDVFISNIVIDEINRTKNINKLELLLSSINKYNLEIYSLENIEIDELSKTYLLNHIVPMSQIDDARHLAYATYFEFDVLLSWNFKHLANMNVQKKLYLFYKF